MALEIPAEITDTTPVLDMKNKPIKMGSMVSMYRMMFNATEEASFHIGRVMMIGKNGNDVRVTVSGWPIATHPRSLKII